MTNPLESLLSPEAQLERRIARVDKLKADVLVRHARHATAQAEQVAAKAAYQESGSDADEAELVAATQRLERAQTVAAAVPDADRLRHDKIQTAENFELLAQAFAKRAAALRDILTTAREQLAARYTELVAQGVRAANFWTDEVAQQRQQRVDAISTALDFSTAKAEHCRRPEAVRVESVDALLVHVKGPLP